MTKQAQPLRKRVSTSNSSPRSQRSDYSGCQTCANSRRGLKTIRSVNKGIMKIPPPTPVNAATVLTKKPKRGREQPLPHAKYSTRNDASMKRLRILFSYLKYAVHSLNLSKIGGLNGGCRLSRVRVAEDHTTAGNGARFNFRVRNGIGWVPRPMAGKPQNTPSAILH